MAWIRYESGVLKHPKWQGIPFASRASALALHVACSGYCGDYLTDGYVPDNILASIAHEAGVKDVTNTLTNLRKTNLIRKVRGGIQIHDYLDYNPAAEDVKKRRTDDAARKKAARQAGLNGKPSGAPSDADSDAPSGAPSEQSPQRSLAGARTRSRGPRASRPIPKEDLSPKKASLGMDSLQETEPGATASPPPTLSPQGEPFDPTELIEAGESESYIETRRRIWEREGPYGIAGRKARQ